MLKHVCAWCWHTRGRFERTHGDVLSGHTGFFSVSHTTHQNATQHNTTTRPQHHTETETETDRDRERTTGDREREEKTEEERTRQEKREDSFSVWWCMAVFCWCSDFLVNSVCARDLSLLNSVKYDSSLISFSAPWQVNIF